MSGTEFTADEPTIQKHGVGNLHVFNKVKKRPRNRWGTKPRLYDTRNAAVCVGIVCNGER